MRISFSDNAILRRDDKIKLEPDSPVFQKFTALENNLAGIKFFLSEKNIEDKNIKLQLLDENCENTLEKKLLKTSLVRTDEYYVFNFSKIKDSKNKSYCFSMTYEPDDGKSKKMPAVTVNYNAGAPFLALIGGQTKNERTDASFAMKLSYKNESLWQDLEELNQRISQYKPWFLKKSYLALIVIAFIALSAVLLVFLMFL